MQSERDVQTVRQSFDRMNSVSMNQLLARVLLNIANGYEEENFTLISNRFNEYHSVLSNVTASISSMSMTKNGNSLMAIKQFLVGLTLTTDLWGHPVKSKASMGISNSMTLPERVAWRFFSDCCSICLTKLANRLFCLIFCCLSRSSYSSSSMSVSLLCWVLLSKSSAALPLWRNGYLDASFAQQELAL